MASEYQPICAAIVIDASNDTIDWEENTVAATATLAHGTYYLYGQGTEPDDLSLAIRDAFNASSPGAHSCSAAAVFGVDVNFPDCIFSVVMISGFGPIAVKLLGSSTFDLGFLGHPQSDTASAAPLNSVFSCSHSWVSNQPASIIDAGPYTRNMMEHVTPDGSVYHFAAGDNLDFRSLGLEYTERPRTFEEGAVFQNTGFNQLWKTINDGRRMKIFQRVSTTIVPGSFPPLDETIVSGLDVNTLVGYYTLTGDSLTSFEPTRPIAGLPAYTWALNLRKVLP